jgi:hypothetical protein
MWSCESCGRPNRRNPLICDTCAAAAPGADPQAVALALRRDLVMESHLRGLAFWYRVGALVFGAGFLALFAVAGRALFAAPSSLHAGDALWASLFGYVAMFVVALAAGSYVLGHHLGRFANGARIAAAVVTLVGLGFAVLRFIATCVAYSRLADLYAEPYFGARPSLAAPIALFVLSAIWSGAMVLTLLSGRAAQVCAPAYRTIVARTASMKASLTQTPFFVLPLVATILAAMVALRLVVAMRG